MYTDGEISDIFAQCREHYNSAAIDEGGDDQQGENDENSNESHGRRQAEDGGSSLSSIERSLGSAGASSGGYEASSSSSSSQTPNIANGRSNNKLRSCDVKKEHLEGGDKHRGISQHTQMHRRRSGSLEAALADGLAQGSAAPPTKSVSFTGNVKPPSSYNRKHPRGRQGQADHEDEPACKVSELDSKERRKSNPNDADDSASPESERHLMKREQALAQRQLLQGNEVTIEQAMTLCRQPR